MRKSRQEFVDMNRVSTANNTGEMLSGLSGIANMTTIGNARK